MLDVLVYGFLSFTLGVPTAHYASCTINHAKIKIFGDYYIVIPICINYFKNRTKTWSFVHPEPHSYPTPSTFRALFVDGTAMGKAGWNSRLADKSLGVNGLWKPRASKGEHAVSVRN